VSKRFIKNLVLSSLSLFCALLQFSCGKPSGIDAGKILLKELAMADSLRAERIIDNNWTAFDILGESFRKNPDEKEYLGLFSTFCTAASANPETINQSDIRTKLEYFGNMLITTPEGGVLVVGGLEHYRMARYSQEVLGKGRSVAVVEPRLFRSEKYNRYMKKRYDLALPDSVRDFIEKNPGGVRIYDAVIEWLAISSGRDVYIGMDYPPIPGKRGCLLGPGRLYSDSLDEGACGRLFLELLGREYSFTEADRGWDRLSESTDAIVQSYSDGLLFLAARWLENSDTASAESLAQIAIERLPRSWQSVELFFFFNKEMPEEVARGYIEPLQNYIRKYPTNLRARQSLEKLLSTSRNGDQ